MDIDGADIAARCEGERCVDWMRLVKAWGRCEEVRGGVEEDGGQVAAVRNCTVASAAAEVGKGVGIRTHADTPVGP
jgi:hypothetical protein